MQKHGNKHSSNGKRLYTLDELPELLLPNHWQEDHVEVSHLNLINDDPEAWLPIDTGNSVWAALPGPEFCPRLYRGQDKQYPTCKASIFRLSSELEYIVAVSKLLEFYGYCEQHPGIHFLRNLEIMGKKGSVDMESQAQHYNLPTTILDFSRSIDVAEFFARCRPSSTKTNSEYIWELIPRSEFDGVLYVADLKKILADKKYKDAFVLTAPSPFLRPHRQKAVGMSLGGKSLTKTSFIEEKRLEFSENRAIELLDKFSEGRFLFPNDIMSKVSERLRVTKQLNIDAFKAATMHVKAPELFESLLDVAKEQNYSFVRVQPLFNPEHVHDLENEWSIVNQEIRKTMKIRLAADPL